jgi:outer membrane protein
MRPILLLLALTFCRAAAADSACQAPSPECTPVGEWDLTLSLGAGTRTNPVANNSDIPLVLVPQISYYGKRVFLENLEVGFTLHEGRSQTFNVIATPGYDRVFFHRNDPQNIFIPFGTLGPTTVQLRVADRHTTYLAGLEWMVYAGKFVGQVDALYEVTGRHQGAELRAALARGFTVGRGEFSASTGLTWKSAEVVDYYYGVEGAYFPDAAVNPFFKLEYGVPLSDRWRFRAFAHYEHLDDAIADSPLISDDSVVTAFAGFVLKIF